MGWAPFLFKCPKCGCEDESKFSSTGRGGGPATLGELGWCGCLNCNAVLFGDIEFYDGEYHLSNRVDMVHYEIAKEIVEDTLSINDMITKLEKYERLPIYDTVKEVTTLLEKVNQIALQNLRRDEVLMQNIKDFIIMVSTSEIERLRKLVAFYQGEVPERNHPIEEEYRLLAMMDKSQRSKIQTDRLVYLAGIILSANDKSNTLFKDELDKAEKA